MQSRETAWAQLARPLDLLVIGGGVTGAAVLLEASRRGLRAGLVERGDFAGGTSSRSSKLVHGGLRYLKQGKIALMRESVREREALLREAPGLVEPMPFLMPQYRGRGPGRAVTQLGLLFYDALAGTRRRGYFTADRVLQEEPLIARDALEGAHVFCDATTDDARLVLRLLSEAQRFGAVSLNYAEVTSFERLRGAIGAAIVRDCIDGRMQHVAARMFVNATGVFADEVRAQLAHAPALRPLRGSHLIVQYDRLPLRHAVAFAHPEDHRPVFAYPWMGTTLVGTTDLDHSGNLHEEPAITHAELRYLMHALDSQFPDAKIQIPDIISTFAGVRPVVAGKAERPSSESRDSLVLQEGGLVTITGGKLTTFRPMALHALRAACKGVHRAIDVRPARIFEQGGRYGAAWAEVLSLPGAGDRVSTTRTTWAEVRYAVASESVVHLDDLLLRRTRLGLQLRDGAAEVFPQLQDICVREYGWSEERWQDELAAYRDRIGAHYSVPA